MELSIFICLLIYFPFIFVLLLKCITNVIHNNNHIKNLNIDRWLIISVHVYKYIYAIQNLYCVYKQSKNSIADMPNL